MENVQGIPGVQAEADAHIAGDASRLTAAQRAWVAQAAELGPRFAARAAVHDTQASFPRENFRELHDAGLLALAVAPERGGAGADLLGCGLVAAELGRWCGATALCFSLHVSNTLWSGLIAQSLPMSEAQRAAHEAARARHEAGIVSEGQVWAQTVSEGSAADAGKAPWATVARRVEGGYVVSGRKVFASMAGEADVHGLLCTLQRPAASQADALFLAVPRDAPGLRVSGEWNPLGMRGTVSRTLEFHDVFVADADRLLPEGLYCQAAARWPAMFLMTSPPYLGLAQAAHDFTVRYLRGEVPGLPPVQRRMYPTKQFAVAQMRLKLEQMRALLLACLAEAGPDPDRHARLRLLAAQYTVVEQSAEICQLALRTCGGQALTKNLPLERLLRDARCGAVMLPWTAEICLDQLGRDSLYWAGEGEEEIEA
jgi:hypothetical protein